MNDVVPWKKALSASRGKFEEIVKQTGMSMPYDREAMFAMQAIQGNDHLMRIANQNPQSLRDAVIDIAAIGLTLNPANAYAYLVPRDNKACLDISYKGLIKLATDTGAVKWAQAELVYESDTFEYRGPAAIPDHHANPFAKDRGEIVGVYCIAKTADDDILVEVMPVAEIDKIRDSSKAKNGPWKQWYGEMARKTVIKRASKRWPYSREHERMAKAVHVLNEHEGLPETNVIDYADQVTPELKARFGELVTAKDGLSLFLWQETDKVQFIDVSRAYCATAPRGQKQALRERIDAIVAEGRAAMSGTLDEMIAGLEANDDCRHLWAELGEQETEWLIDRLPLESVPLAREGLKAAQEAT